MVDYPEVFRARNPSREVVTEEGAYVNATPRKDGKHVSSAPYQPAPTRSSSPLLLYIHDLPVNNFTMSAQQKVQQHPAFQQAQAKAHYYLAQLDKELSKYPVLVSLEQRVQVPKAYAFIGAVALLGLLHVINALAAPVSNLIGWGLPAYLSFKALESPGNDDDVQWLTYWVIFGFFNFAEGFALRALLYYFPWYFSFKTLFILWLQLPAFRGAQIAYYSVLRPVLANVSHRTGPARSFSNDTVTAEGLRDRVATATTE